MQDFKYHQESLENGLNLHILKKTNCTTFSLFFLYRVGSGNEGQRLRGIAHFLEHMMFKGSKNYPLGSIDKLISSLGGENNAFTCKDYTAYYYILPFNTYEVALDLERDRLENLNLFKADFLKERQVVIEEINLYADDPFEAMQDLHFELAYPNLHPYKHPVLGYEETLLNLELDDLKQFYNNFYRIDNLDIICVGKIDNLNKLISNIKNRFANILAKKEPLTKEPVFEEQQLKSQAISLAMDIDTVKVKLSFPFPKFSLKNDILADLLEEILASSRTSVLVKLLKEEQQIARNIGIGNSMLKDTDRFFIDIEFKNKIDINNSLKLIYTCFDNLLINGISEDALKRAKNKLLTSYYFEQEKSEEVAYSFAQYVFLNKVDDFFNYEKTLKAINLAELNNFIREIFKKEHMLLSLVYPKTKKPPPQPPLWN